MQRTHEDIGHIVCAAEQEQSFHKNTCKQYSLYGYNCIAGIRDK